MTMIIMYLLCPCVKRIHCTAQPRTETIDLESDNSLRIEISDALSEQDKVKFTIHTKVPVCKHCRVHSRRGPWVDAPPGV